MRIVGGEWKGRSLMAPAGRGTRPTSDKVREAIFDVLGALPEVHAAGQAALAEQAAPSAQVALAGQPAGQLAGPFVGHCVLDLFAGSGALGLEALSRGATSCTFVEIERAALRSLRGNLRRLGVAVAGRPARGESETAGGRGEAGAESGSGAEHVGMRRALVLTGDARRALRADARRGARYTLVFADPPYERYAEVRPALSRLLAPLLAARAALVIETAAGTAVDLPWAVVREKRYGDTKVTFLVSCRTDAEQGATVDDDTPRD